MQHAWEENYNIDCTSIIWSCRRCKARFVVMKNRCDFHSPDENEELLEKHHIALDCDVQIARNVMES